MSERKTSDMDEEDSDPAAEPSRDGAATKKCERCGEVIATSDWYPVTSERGDGGSLRLYHFCSEECQAAWLDDRRE